MIEIKESKKSIKKKMFNLNPHCVYCEAKTQMDNFEHLNYATIDHLNPIFSGGKNEESNYVLACSFCNQIKSNKYEFRGFKVKANANLDYASVRDLMLVKEREPLIDDIIPLFEKNKLIEILEIIKNKNYLMLNKAFKKKLIKSIRLILLNYPDHKTQMVEAKRLFECKRKSIVALRVRLNPQPIEVVSFKIDNNQITYQKT